MVGRRMPSGIAQSKKGLRTSDTGKEVCVYKCRRKAFPSPPPFPPLGKKAFSCFRKQAHIFFSSLSPSLFALLSQDTAVYVLFASSTHLLLPHTRLIFSASRPPVRGPRRRKRQRLTLQFIITAKGEEGGLIHLSSSRTGCSGNENGGRRRRESSSQPGVSGASGGGRGGRRRRCWRAAGAQQQATGVGQ